MCMENVLRVLTNSNWDGILANIKIEVNKFRTRNKIVGACLNTLGEAGKVISE